MEAAVAVKKKQLAAADKLLAAGDLRRVRMHVDMAVAMDRSRASPEVQRAGTAYRVLAANNNDKADHYGVLGVAAPPGGKPTKESHDDVKAQNKALCETFEADTSSSAVAAALKLVNQAFAALTDIRKNAAAVAVAGPATRRRMPPLLPVPRPKAKATVAPARVVVVGEQGFDADYVPPVVPEHKGQAAVADDDEEDEDYHAGGRGRGGRR